MVTLATNTAEKNFRFRLDPEKKDRFAALCNSKKISQQDAIESLIDLLLVQDELVQSMLLGQTPSGDDLIEVVLRRLSKRRPGLRPRVAAMAKGG